jgi:hypothetical protein
MDQEHWLLYLAGFMCIVSITIIVVFLWYWGTFRYPFYVWFSIVATMGITFFQTFGIFPYDITTALTNTTTPAMQNVIWWCAQSNYWCGFAMGWVIMPVFVITFQYRYAITWARSFYYSIRFNIIWYLVAGAVCLAGLIALLVQQLKAGKRPGLTDLVHLCIALTNGYGMILLMSGLGHGLVEFPRQMWKMADPGRKLRTLLDWLNMFAENSGQGSVNGRAVLEACNQARATMSTQVREVIMPHLEWRQTRIEEQCRIRTLPESFYRMNPDDSFTEWSTKDFGQSTVEDLENLLAKCDDVITQMDDHYWMVDAKITEAVCTMRWLIDWTNGKFLARLRSFGRYLGAMAVIIIHLVIAWWEVMLMPSFLDKWKWTIWYGPWYILVNNWAKPNLSPSVFMLFVITPIISYMVFVGGWITSYLWLGRQFYRFVPHHTNENTAYYWNLVQARLGEALIYHFLLQLGGRDEVGEVETFKVYGQMDEVVFIGNEYNFLMPIGSLVIAIIVLLRLWQRCTMALGCRTIHIHPEDFSVREFETSFQIIRSVRHDCAPLLDHPVIRALVREVPLLSPTASTARTTSLESYYW